MSYTGLNEKLWWQAFRPQTLDDIILPAFIKNPITQYVRVDKSIPHLVFVSSLPGSGKTTLAHAIIKELGADYLAIKASTSSGIDVVRSVIEPFATRESLYEETCKIVWLDEADRMSPAMQEGLRSIMEEYSSSIQFILTGNNIGAIIEPVLDRCEIYDFNFNKPAIKDEIIISVFNRAKYILDEKNVSYDEGVLIEYVGKNYPRIRGIISGLQRYAKGNGNIIDKGIINTFCIDESFYDMILTGKYTDAKEMVLKTGAEPDSIYDDLYHNCLPKITDKNVYAPFLLTLNKYSVQNTQVMNKELNLVAGLMELCLLGASIKR